MAKWQASGETVEHAEKVSAEHVINQRFGSRRATTNCQSGYGSMLMGPTP